MKKIFYSFFLANSLFCYSQEANVSIDDTTNSEELDRVIVIGKSSGISQKLNKSLGSLDSYLESDNRINMIRRGSYAWEPILNGMTSERSVTTIDGMRIYGACTDKMDPVTSYVEITNLSKADVQSGQSGAMHGSTIAGSIDLIRNQGVFDNSGWNGMVMLGLESNNYQQIAGTKLNYQGKRFFSNIDFTFRDADNYKAGKRLEVLYSQFRKYNTSGAFGFQINEHQALKASVIYDLATNVGYPALPMDVSKAEAVIASLQYEWHHINPYIHHWETKVYFNKVTHIMDDSKRPIVSIRMDMPGYSTTGGFYSLMKGDFGKRNQWKANLSGHFNYSLAEMTMYPNDPNEKAMFMLTWPGVETYYTNLFLEDKFQLNDKWTMTASFGNSIHHNFIYSDFGAKSLEIFYPDVNRSKTRWLNNSSLTFEVKHKRFKHTMGVSYGERAPSVSEGYGFYLFNSLDKYDYIGNPNLKKEKSWSLFYNTTYAFPFMTISRTVAYFGIFDYTLGMPHPELYAMTIGSKGVRIYDQLHYVNQLNVDFKAKFKIHKTFYIEANAIYRKGFTMQLSRMPFIQPFSYGGSLRYENKGYMAEVVIQGAIKRRYYNAEFGENATPAYGIINLNFAKQLSFEKQELTLKIGVENLLDTYYYTFSDWNKIPRIGRNFYMNLIFKF